MLWLLVFATLYSVIAIQTNNTNECKHIDDSSECITFNPDRYINANRIITDAEKQSYKENGFIIIRNALSADQLELWRELIDNAVDSRGIDHIFPQKGQLDTVNSDFGYFKNVFTQRINLWQNDDEVCKLVGSAGYIIGRIASELEGVEIGYRLHHDQALYKEPFANPTGFHIDVPYWTFNSTHGLSCWVPLDNVSQQNGCLYYIAGSHQAIFNKDNPYKLVKIGKNMNDVFDTYPEFLDDKYKCIAAEVNAGDMVLHNGLVIHAAGPNFTNKRRRAMTMGMFPIGTVFNGQKNILTDEQFNTYKVGELLNDINQNPVLYSTEKVSNNHKCFVNL